MLLRPGNAGSDAFTDHRDVLAARKAVLFSPKTRRDRQGHRTAEPCPRKTWQVNADRVLDASIAADLTARTRLLGLHDQDELNDPEPDTLRCGSGTSPRGSPGTPGSTPGPAADWSSGRVIRPSEFPTRTADFVTSRDVA